MVSKPNPNLDSEIRYRLYNSYQRQMPMWDHPGDFNVGLPLRDSMGGCYNCNAAFKLGSGRAIRPQDMAYNAYDSPSQFFFVPNKIQWVDHLPSGSGKKGIKNSYEKAKKKQEVETDWYELVKELVPIGFQIADIVKIFYDKYGGKYGEGILNDLMNLDASNFEHQAQQLGQREYY